MGRSRLLEFRAWLASAPVGTQLPAASLLEAVDKALEGDPAEVPATPSAEGAPHVALDWRALLWLVPAETRIGVHELAEALGRSPSWIYRRTSTKAAEKIGCDLLPFRKLEGELQFVVGEVRSWIRDHEEVVTSAPMESTTGERRLFSVVEGGAG